MGNDRKELPEVSDGTLTLLAIALKNDKEKMITQNPALRASLRCMAELPSRCAGGEPVVREYLGVHAQPLTFFRFCAGLLDRVDRQLLPPEGISHASRSRRSEYDHPVLLALGQTVARAAGMRPDSEPGLGPALKELAWAEPGTLQRDLMRNYFGNILQDWFEACEIRLQVPDLPASVEGDLRDRDARLMAEWLLPAEGANKGGADIDDLIRRLGKLMVGLFLKEGRRT